MQGQAHARGGWVSRAKPMLAVLAYCKGAWVRAREPVIWDQESLAYDGATGRPLQPGHRQTALPIVDEARQMVVTGLPSVKSQ
jgi:hypothetical protein